MAGENKNPYQTLGVKETCTNEEVKAAYLRLAKKWHPDVNHSSISTEKFRDISAAFDTLKDESSRYAYNEKRRNASVRDYYTAQSAKYGNGSHTQDMWSTSVPADENFGFWRTMFRKPVVRYGLFPVAVILTGYCVARVLVVPSEKSLVPAQQYGGNVPTVEAWYNPKSQRWETPAPWNADYRRSVAGQPAQWVRKDHVHDSAR